MKNIKIILSAALLTTLFSCVNSDNYAVPDLSGECGELTTTKAVQDINVLATTTYQSYLSTVPVGVNPNDVIEAYVTSSDEGGNFYKSISLVSLDGTIGFSMPIDAYNLYTKYEPGRKVFIKVKDTYFVNENNALVIGSLYDGGTPAILTDDSVGRISGIVYESIVKKSCTKVDEDLIVNNLTIAAAKTNANLNKLIELDNVQFTDLSLSKSYFDATLNNLGGATNHEIIDAAGTKIILRVSEFANFAANKVPSNNGKIRGVLTKFGSTFQFMVRTESDIKLTNPRKLPVFEETFATNFPNWVKYSVSGTQVWATESGAGNAAPCARMSGFASGNNLNEDWLISPAINLTGKTATKLSFDSDSSFTGNVLEVYVSSNYDGVSAPSTATWTLVSAPLDTNSTVNTFFNSGLQNISAFDGLTNVRVAFKYTSTTSASRTWKVDNVKVDAL